MLFRVWCKDKNEWEKDEIRLGIDGGLWCWFYDSWAPLRLDNHTVEFSTGLKDANGKEIFQGDIIKGTIHSHWSHNIIRCEVVWNEVSACFECRQYVKRVFGRFWSHKVKFSKDVKVIGNIHENKNLLDMDTEGNYVVPSLG